MNSGYEKARSDAVGALQICFMIMALYKYGALQICFMIMALYKYGALQICFMIMIMTVE